MSHFRMAFCNSTRVFGLCPDLTLAESSRFTKTNVSQTGPSSDRKAAELTCPEETQLSANDARETTSPRFHGTDRVWQRARAGPPAHPPPPATPAPRQRPSQVRKTVRQQCATHRGGRELWNRHPLLLRFCTQEFKQQPEE